MASSSLVHLIPSDLIENARRGDVGPRSRVVRVIDELYTVKLGKAVNRAQYDLLCDVYNSGTIPCPEPIEFIELGDGANAILMSTIEGTELVFPLKKMTDEQIITLAEDLAKGMEKLHKWMVKNRPHDGRSIYSVGQTGPITYPMAHSFVPSPVAIDEWTNVLCNQSPMSTVELSNLQRRVLEKLVEGEIKFCHMDIQTRNVMVKDGELAALIDWDHAGWYTRNMEAFGMIWVHAPSKPGTKLRFFLEKLFDHWNLSDTPLWTMATSDRLDLGRGGWEIERERMRKEYLERKAKKEKLEAISAAVDASEPKAVGAESDPKAVE